ncbi:flagellar hook-associated family protein [Aureimonas sp. AU12]|uniref:flagellar hook-associated family protein n=1 Tax=Aureimonas sp. AU12 TaxID=1638161 RepID=UPI000782BADE|nr:flagellar hook-associated family protein [Aureimonas sp. AU12]
MSISSLTLSNFSRASIQKIQSQILDANKEFTSGRHADVGLTLGRLTSNTITYRAQDSSIERTLESNKLVSFRLESTQDTLDAVRATGEKLQSTFITGVATPAGTAALVTEATNAMQQFVGLLNTSDSGQYLFSGTQSDVQPMTDGSAAVSTAFDAFLAVAGTGGTPVTRATVSKDALSQYFSSTGYTAGGNTYRYDDLFNDAVGTTPGDTSWNPAFSKVDGDIAQVRISKTETIGTSVSVNDPAIRKTAAAYAMITALGISDMGTEARAVVAKAAAEKLASGMTGIVNLSAEVGARETRVEAANTALTKQQDIVKASYENLEGVDQTEASLRITTLKTQLEASFAVTGKLQGLSILDYI